MPVAGPFCPHWPGSKAYGPLPPLGSCPQPSRLCTSVVPEQAKGGSPPCRLLHLSLSTADGLYRFAVESPSPVPVPHQCGGGKAVGKSPEREAAHRPWNPASVDKGDLQPACMPHTPPRPAWIALLPPLQWTGRPSIIGTWAVSHGRPSGRTASATAIFVGWNRPGRQTCCYRIHAADTFVRC